MATAKTGNGTFKITKRLPSSKSDRNQVTLGAIARKLAFRIASVSRKLGRVLIGAVLTSRLFSEDGNENGRLHAGDVALL